MENIDEFFRKHKDKFSDFSGAAELYNNNVGDDVDDEDIGNDGGNAKDDEIDYDDVISD